MADRGLGSSAELVSWLDCSAGEVKRLAGLGGRAPRRDSSISKPTCRRIAGINGHGVPRLAFRAVIDPVRQQLVQGEFLKYSRQLLPLFLM